MSDLEASSGEFAHCTRLNIPSLNILLTMVVMKLVEIMKKTEPLFGLSILGFRRNMAVQNGRLQGRKHVFSVDIKGPGKVIQTQQFSFSGDYDYEHILMIIIFSFCHSLQIGPP